MAFEEQIDVNSDLHEVRTSAIKNFENKGFPTKKEEAWKYTSLNSVLKNDFSVFPKSENNIEFADVKKYFLHEIDTYKVVFIDGVFSSFLSSTTHDGIDVCLMSSALNKPKYKMVIDNYFNKIANLDEIDNTYVSQKQETNVSVNTFSFGGNLTRNNLNFYHFGERIVSNLNGITIIGDKQHVDHYTLVQHSTPNCESHQDYKGIFSDRSTGVFNGKIYVEKEAQKTNAFQKSNKILLSDKSTINAKPQLEIFADDVKCSHGCTIGQLDETAMFYMQQRGIPKKEAKALLMYAFSNAVIESIKIPELKQRITKIIATKLGVKLGFDL